VATLNYDEWLAQVPESIKRDPLWSFQVYPKALMLSDLVWEDTDRMMKDPRGRVIARQLVDSVGSICANIEEGHGRGFGKENAYFQRVALGSARESRGWYYRGRRFLSLPEPQSVRAPHSTARRNHRCPGRLVGPTTTIPKTLALHLASCTLHPASCILHPAPCILHPAPCILHLAPCILHPAPCILHPAPCILHPASCTLHPASCILHPASCILLPCTHCY